jgi:low affinity Fe/Cu permease
VKERFRILADRSSRAAGSAPAFAIAFAIVALWSLGGFFVGFENAIYQLAINTLTTIITFLMVFLIQNSSNRANDALQRKLDALIEASSADNRFAGLDDATDDELEALHEHFRGLRAPRS